MQSRIYILFCIFFLSACSIDQINKKNFAELTSTAAGGYLGYELADGDLFATSVGSAAGVILGKYLSDFVGQDDYFFYKKEALRILEINSDNFSGYWKNPISGNEGVVKIKGYYGDPECRLIEHIFSQKKKTIRKLDTACREDGGQWAMIK